MKIYIVYYEYIYIYIYLLTIVKVRSGNCLLYLLLHVFVKCYIVSLSNSTLDRWYNQQIFGLCLTIFAHEYYFAIL